VNNFLDEKFLADLEVICIDGKEFQPVAFVELFDANSIL
jgi:hypothetical protein